MPHQDFHDPKFDKHVLTTDYSTLLQYNDIGRNQYSGVPVDNEYLSYRIRVYPTKEFRGAYLTKKPLLYSGLMVAVFLVTAVVSSSKCGNLTLSSLA